jgi:surface antigen
MEARMRQLAYVVGLALACCSCAGPGPQRAVISQVTTSIPPDHPDCRDYTAQAMVDGKAQPIRGRACRQPDGSWRIVEGTAEQPSQFVAVYPPPPYMEGPYYDDWFWGPPIGLGFGSLVFVDRFHRFHDFGRFHRFAGDRFHGGRGMAFGGMGHFHGGGFAHGGMGHR